MSDEELLQFMEEEGAAGYIAKSVVIDCATNHGSGSFMGVRSVDFWSEGSKIAVAAADGVGGATSEFGGTTLAEFSFYTALSKVGSLFGNQWFASATTNQRLFFTFNTPITFDRIDINNSLNGNGFYDTGVNAVKIYTTEDINAISNAYNSPIPGSVLIYDDVFRIHVSAEVEDPETLVLIP